MTESSLVVDTSILVELLNLPGLAAHHEDRLPPQRRIYIWSLDGALVGHDTE